VVSTRMLRCAVGRAVVSHPHLHAGVRCGQRVRLMVRWLNERDAIRCNQTQSARTSYGPLAQ
jgi:hypothetical protein